jgi:hypothetical protein
LLLGVSVRISQVVGRYIVSLFKACFFMFRKERLLACFLTLEHACVWSLLFREYLECGGYEKQKNGWVFLDGFFVCLDFVYW